MPTYTSTFLSAFLPAFLLSALVVLGFPPVYLFPVAIASVAGICYLWQQASSPKAAFQLGFTFGLGLYCVGIYWIYIARF